MNNSYYPLLMVLLIVALGIGGRLLLMRLVHTACPAVQDQGGAVRALYPGPDSDAPTGLSLCPAHRGRCHGFVSGDATDPLRGQHDRPLCRFSLPDSRREAPALRQR